MGLYGLARTTVFSTGFMFYGWRCFSEGYAIATKWFVILWLPIFPVKRYKLEVVADSHKGKSSASTTACKYFIKEELPLNISEIFLTYLKGYIVLPMLMVGPMFLPTYLMEPPIRGPLLSMFGPIFFPQCLTESLVRISYHEWHGHDTLLMIFLVVFSALSTINLIFWPCWVVLREYRRRQKIFWKHPPS